MKRPWPRPTRKCPRRPMTPRRARRTTTLTAEEAAQASRQSLEPNPKNPAPSKNPPVDDPAVLAVLESHPQTPAELLRAINILVDLEQALAGEAFRRRVGPGETRCRRQGGAGPAIQFRDAAQTGQQQRTRPGAGAVCRRLAQIGRRVIVATQSGLPHGPNNCTTPTNRCERKPRWHWSGPAKPPWLRWSRFWPIRTAPADRKSAQDILVQLDDLAVAPLLGVLGCPDAALKTRVIEVLGQLRAHQAVAQLLFPLLSPASTPELRAAAAQALRANCRSCARSARKQCGCWNTRRSVPWSNRGKRMTCGRRRSRSGIGTPSARRACRSSTTRPARRWPLPLAWLATCIDSIRSMRPIGGCI